MGTRWNKLKKFRDVILYGSGKTAVTMRYDDGSNLTTSLSHLKVIPNMERRWQETTCLDPGRIIQVSDRYQLRCLWRQPSETRSAGREAGRQTYW